MRNCAAAGNLSNGILSSAWENVGHSSGLDRYVQHEYAQADQELYCLNTS